VDTRISREKAAGLSTEELHLALINPIADDVTRGTSGQAVLARATFFIREVDNGGLAQAFHNLSLEDMQLALDSFDALGAGQHAAIVRLALARMLEGEWPLTDEDMQTRVAELSAEWIDENFDELDEQLYDERQLYPYIERFVEEHPEEFFLPG
jgi:hypothetical protein